MGTEENQADFGSSSPWSTVISFRKAKAFCGALWLVLLLHDLPSTCSVTRLGSRGKSQTVTANYHCLSKRPALKSSWKLRVTQHICSVLGDPTSVLPWAACQQHLQFWGSHRSQAAVSHGQCQDNKRQAVPGEQQHASKAAASETPILSSSQLTSTRKAIRVMKRPLRLVITYILAEQNLATGAQARSTLAKEYSLWSF